MLSFGHVCLLGLSSGAIETRRSSSFSFSSVWKSSQAGGLDLASIDLVQHLVSTARIKIEGDVAQPGIAVAANQCVESRSCCPTGSSLPENKLDRQIAADLAECDRIGQPRRCAEEGNKRSGGGLQSSGDRP